MEPDQVEEEANGAKIEEGEEAERRDQSLRQFLDRGLVDPLRVDNRKVLCRQVDDDQYVGHKVDKTHPEDPDNQAEKVVVIALTDAVVQIDAVVVEPRAAAVAGAAVFAASHDVVVAYLAVKLIRVGVKFDPFGTTLVLQLDSRISGVSVRGDVRIVEGACRQDQVGHAEETRQEW